MCTSGIHCEYEEEQFEDELLEDCRIQKDIELSLIE